MRAGFNATTYPGQKAPQRVAHDTGDPLCARAAGTTSSTQRTTNGAFARLS